MFSKLAVGHRCSFQAGICTCLIQCNRVKTCKHSDIRKNCCVIFSMAVTVRADILYQRYMETWTSMTDSLCIFCHFAVQKLIGTVVGIIDSVKTTGTDTTSAAFTFIIIYDCFFVYISKGITAAFFCTTLASATKLFVYCRLATCMLLHFTCTTAAAHTDILKCSSKSGSFMTFEMRQTDKNVCIHDRMTDEGCLTVFTVYYRHFHLVCSTKSVTNDHMTACSDGVKSVQRSTVQMIQCILSAAWIQCVTVCQERFTALFLTEVCHNLCIVRAKESHISQFSEVHLDSNKLTFHIHIFDACCNAELFQFIQPAGSNRTTKVCKINSRFFHVIDLLLL